ncbi:AAA family ATPase [Burkholderia glumae]|uniref:AAA family ATPase n=1 Tax=Burkholderia glumae TaxID=337 RepID=UPI000C271651|nr:AAA family ATPase [Burkholderia glumae]PJO21052.1 exodeoxyribonuclease V subunit alpha [Burkholderia glumae AU6208]QHE09617.1 AAA family ATPase [Burkholderia glumae AU6208]
MKDLTEPFGFVGGLAERLPEPADFGLALAEGFARRIGMLSRRLGAPADAARWAARAAFAASRATAAGHVCIALGALAARYAVSLDQVRAELAASGVTAFGRAPRGADCPLVVDAQGRLYLARYFDYETRLADALVAHARAARPEADGALAPARLRESLARYFAPPREGEIDWQRVAAVVALGGRLTIVSGGPGTGKTTTVVGVIACLIELQPALRIALAAPTGKAAQRMQEALHARAAGLPAEFAAQLPRTSYTLHRLLGWLPGGRFRHHRDNPLPYDLVVVDEASMIDVALAAHLLDALAPGARLVLLGDKDQLAAVEAGAVFAELSARPAFSAAGCERIAAALGVSPAAFVAALPDEARATAPAGATQGANRAGADGRPASAAAPRRRGARPAPPEAGGMPVQRSLFDFDEVAASTDASACAAESASRAGQAGFADAPLEAWIEPDELAWLDAWRIDEVQAARFDAGRTGMPAVPGLGREPASHADAPAVGEPLADCVVWLERNYRFGLDSPIGRLSLAIRRGDAQAALDALSTQADAAARFIDDGGDALAAATIERLADGFAAYGRALREVLAGGEPDPLPLFDVLNRFRVLCATRTGARGADEINLRVAALVRRAVGVPLAVGAHWFAGRPVMVTRNDYALGLFNGDIGIALHDAQGALRVWFRGADGLARAVSPAALPPHDTAFALTVHKSQGSEFDEAALVLPAAFGRVLSRELVYTAITRARSRVQVIGPRAVLAQAIATRTQRDSGLAARIADAAQAAAEAEARH